MKNKIIERNYDWALDCLVKHGLPMEDYHGDICIFLCELVDRFPDNTDIYYHSRIHLRVHKLLEQHLKLIKTEVVSGIGYAKSYFDPSADIELKADVDYWIEYGGYDGKPLFDGDKTVVELLRQGYNYTDIAEIMDKSISTIINKVHRVSRLASSSRCPFRERRYEYGSNV